jgi:hypothetical protein
VELNELTAEAKRAHINVTASREEIALAPFAYANHVEVRGSGDETSVTFYLRQDYAAVVSEEGVMQSHAKPIITIAFTPSVARRFIDALQTVLPKNSDTPI